MFYFEDETMFAAMPDPSDDTTEDDDTSSGTSTAE